MAGFVSSRRVDNHANQPLITHVAYESKLGLTAISAKGSKPASQHLLSEPRRQSLGLSYPFESSARVNLINDQGSCRTEEETKAISLETTCVKRRLGMGRGTSGYNNKKFKPP